MQPRVLALLLVLLPLLASNGAFLLSASAGHVPWCIPYIDGCSSISQAGRSGDTIFYYRALVFPYGVFFILFWLYARQWLSAVQGKTSMMADVIFWMGVTGSVGLLIYINYLGTTGEFNIAMRRTGAALYFVLIPLAQTLMYIQHRKLDQARPDIDRKALKFQSIIVIMMVSVAIVSISLTLAEMDTYEIQNIVEWNYSLLVNLYSASMFFMWKKLKWTGSFVDVISDRS